MNIPVTLADKAQGFVDDGMVTRVKGGAYVVIGSTGTPYTVFLSHPDEVIGACSCPATSRVCSHLLAACIFHLSNPPEVANMADYRDPFRGLTSG